MTRRTGVAGNEGRAVEVQKEPGRRGMSCWENVEAKGKNIKG